MMQFRVYRNWLRQWRWTLVAANGRKIANSGEGYRNKEDCFDAIALVKQSASAQILEKT